MTLDTIFWSQLQCILSELNDLKDKKPIFNFHIDKDQIQ